MSHSHTYSLEIVTIVFIVVVRQWRYAELRSSN